ncbi:hypothetical protein [Haloglomus salinum]|jgi:hypothetical protein|uniref:hypothetical protein n=1 Tax=Haloglomus salinum TaxID=2962673 RepID=UPI0020C9FB61|nr:hypothetical protein [Haloglomus salinum]
MTEVIRTRLFVLAGLTVIGVAVAGMGTAFGVTAPVSNSGTAGEFVVSNENVTFVGTGGSETVVTDLTNVSEITVEQTSTGQFTVKTSTNRPLTEAERERARMVAMNNHTVEQALASMGEYELTVEPVRGLNLSASSQRSYDVRIDSNQTSGEFTITDTGTDNREDGSVTVKREPRYVEDQAVVRIRQPRDDGRDSLKYSVSIDLTNGTVTDVTDWDSIRQNSTSTN